MIPGRDSAIIVASSQKTSVLCSAKMKNIFLGKELRTNEKIFFAGI